MVRRRTVLTRILAASIAGPLPPAQSGPAGAADSAPSRNPSRTLKLLHDPYPPYVGQDLAGGGMAVSIVRDALLRGGWGLSYDIMPWARALATAMAGQAADGMISAWYSETRNERLAFSQPYLINRVRLFTTPDRAGGIDGIDSLTGRTIGVVRGYDYDARITGNDRLRRYETATLALALKMLVAGRIDAIPEDEGVLAYTIRAEVPELAGHIVAGGGPPLSENGMRLAISRHRPDAAAIVVAFDAAILQMIRSGEIDTIKSRFPAPA